MQTPTINPEAPLLVAKATGTLALAGAATGGTIAVLRGQQPLGFVFTMGLNGAVAGLSFFGLREYLVSPLLVAGLDWPSYVRRRRADDTENDPEDEISFIRNDRVLDSALAGGIAGSTISGLSRGRRTVPAAFITSALITSALQYGVNNIRVARIQTLLSSHRSQPPLMAPTAPKPSFLSRVQDTLGRWSPVRKLSDEEYAGILQRQRAEVQDALRKWESWMARSADDRLAVGARPEINVEQATRELDSLERKIRVLEGKVRERGQGLAAEVEKV